MNELALKAMATILYKYTMLSTVEDPNLDNLAVSNEQNENPLIM